MSLKILRHILFSIFAVSQFSLAGHYYISPAGSDSWPGSLSYPFATIQRGEIAAIPGDTIDALSGIYYETIIIHQGGIEGAQAGSAEIMK